MDLPFHARGQNIPKDAPGSLLWICRLAPGAVDKTHRIQALFCLVICPDVWESSLIGKERMSQPVGGKNEEARAVPSQGGFAFDFL